jgi:hypothetical protein
MRRIVSILLALFTTACATVHHGPMQRIQVDSAPAGVTVRSTGCGPGSTESATTPATVWVSRRATRCTLTLSASGYREEIVLLRRGRNDVTNRNFNAAGVICEHEANCNSFHEFFGVLALGALLGGTGLGVDAATGARYEQQPSYVAVTLRAVTEADEPQQR